MVLDIVNNKGNERVRDKNSWNNFDILFLPLHRKIDSSWGGEFIFPLRLGVSISKMGGTFKAVCGTIDKNSKVILEGYGNKIIPILKNDRYITNRSGRTDVFYDAAFYIKLLFKGKRNISNNTIVHHAFPLGQGRGFNPFFIFDRKIPKVIGPLLYRADSALEATNPQAFDINLIGANNKHVPVFSEMYRKTVLNADLIIFDSNLTREQVIGNIENSSEKDFLILPSCGMNVVKDKKFPEKCNAPDSDLLFAIITYLVPRKRVDTVLKALKLFPEKNIRIDVIGDGPNRQYLEEMAKQLRINDRVRFIGANEHTKVEKVFGRYDAIIHLDQVPHLVNSTSQEALAHGVPLIFSEGSRVKEYIEFPYGWQVDLIDSEVLSGLFTFLSSHGEALLEKSKNAIRYAKGNLSYESVGAALLEAYDKLVNS